MYGNTQFSSPSKTRRVSLNVIETEDTLILRERAKHRRPREISEAAISFVATFIIFFAYLQLLFPNGLFGANDFSVPLTFSVSAIAAGLALYAFGTRGYQPEVGVDKKSKEIWTCKLNSKGRARVKTHFSKRDIKSMYIMRPSETSRDAALFLRLEGNAQPKCLFRGDLDEIESAHRKLCDVFQAQNMIQPDKNARKVSPRRVKATGRVRAAFG